MHLTIVLCKKIRPRNINVCGVYCSPTWVHSFQEWTREGPLLQIVTKAWPPFEKISGFSSHLG
jgi:hypothetical protein